MSVQTMAAVWKGSQHGGSALLMMLAIADFSDDKGVAYPAVSTLAEKTRMRPRNAHYLLSELQASGELVVKVGSGPRGTNLYRIAIDRLHGVQPSAGVHRSAGVQAIAGLHPSAGGGAGGCEERGRSCGGGNHGGRRMLLSTLITLHGGCLLRCGAGDESK